MQLLAAMVCQKEMVHFEHARVHLVCAFLAQSGISVTHELARNHSPQFEHKIIFGWLSMPCRPPALTIYIHVIKVSYFHCMSSFTFNGKHCKTTHLKTF